VVDLDFSVDGAEPLAYAAVPTLVFKLRIRSTDVEAVRAIALGIQVRIAAMQRAYTRAEQERLLDVFSEPARWGQTLRSLLWTTFHVHVAGFVDQTVVDVSMPCTYDFDVVASKYFDALQDGHIPLELLFNGTLFYSGEDGRLQAAQIGWDKEAGFDLPVRVWKDVMQLHFPNSAWLRVHKDVFDRLNSYRMRNALPTWESALESLLEAGERTPDPV
jgi:hypothetical protein